jgi:predicted RNA-binding protein
MNNQRSYWLTVWSLTTWREFLRAGGDVYGLPPRYQKQAMKLKIGDQLICYMKGRSEFFAVLEVASLPWWDNKQIWSEDIYPVRLRVRQVLVPRNGVTFLGLFKRLSLYSRLKDPSNPKCWGNHFHQSVRAWNEQDARVVLKALRSQAGGEANAST